MPDGRERLPAWLRPEVARGIADAARAALRKRGCSDSAKAAVRSAAVACLPSLPASMLAELVEALAPAEPPPEHALPSVAPADPGRLARRLAPLAAADGGNLPAGPAAGRLAARLAGMGAALIGTGQGRLTPAEVSRPRIKD